MVEPERDQSMFLVGALRDHTYHFAKANEMKPNDLSGLRDHLVAQREIPSQAA